MKKAVIFAGLVVIALLPAVIGLTSNPSLSAGVPLQPAQVQVVSESPTGSAGSAPTERSTPRASATHRASSTPGPTRSDDHGGDRNDDDSSGHGRGRGRGGDD